MSRKQTIYDQWQNFSATLPAETTALQSLELRRSYYRGAYAVLQLLFATEFDTLRQECVEFESLVRDGKA